MLSPPASLRHPHLWSGGELLAFLSVMIGHQPQIVYGSPAKSYCSAQFSSDADAGVIEDARYKRREALADLAAVAEKKK